MNIMFSSSKLEYDYCLEQLDYATKVLRYVPPEPTEGSGSLSRAGSKTVLKCLVANPSCRILIED